MTPIDIKAMAEAAVASAMRQNQEPGDNEGMSPMRQDQFKMLLQRVAIAEYALKRVAYECAPLAQAIDVAGQALQKCQTIQQEFLRKYPD